MTDTSDERLTTIRADRDSWRRVCERITAERDAANARAETAETQVERNLSDITALETRLDAAERSLDAVSARVERLRGACGHAKKSLPPDPNFDAAWSVCIAILDEALKDTAPA